jgi:glycosyltransferase involved in cell wall biosynthesis
MPQSNNTVSVILPIHNQQEIASMVIRNVIDNASPHVRELFVLLDGCTDASEEIVMKEIQTNPNNVKIVIARTNDIWELLCCNLGFQASTCDYSINIQDDMVVTEKDYDQRFIKPFEYVPNLLAVSGRDAVDGFINASGELDFCNVSGKDVETPRNVFSVRDIINRPIAFHNERLREMGYLDVEFVPSYHGDTDISLRAWRKGYVVGSYVIDYISELRWGTSRKNPISSVISENARIVGAMKIIQRHKDLLIGEKHSYDIIID